MSWRSREERPRWNEHDNRWGDARARSPVWEARWSPERRDRRYDRNDRNDRSDRRDRYRPDRPDRPERPDRNRMDRDRVDRDRYDKTRDRDRDRERDRERERERERDRERRRSPPPPPSRSYDKDRDLKELPSTPSPPTISDEFEEPVAPARSRSRSRDRQEETEKDEPGSIIASPGDWFCKCGLYNFKRRLVCYRRNCQGKRAEGIVYKGDSDRAALEAAGITKRLLFRRLDALTTEEKILDAIKERCSKTVLDSIVGITIGRETLTGASKCLAYVNFNSIADSTAAHSELSSLIPPLEIDSREVLISFYNEPKKLSKPSNSDYSSYYAQMAKYAGQSSTQALSEADRVNAAAAVAQSAISAAQARQMAWTTGTVPTFVVSTSQPTPTVKLPTGDGKTKYSPPDVRTFLYDESSGYYYDPATGLYYESNSQYFFNSQSNQYMYWDAASSTYIAATQTQQNTEQAKLPKPPEATVENTIPKDQPEEKKKKEKEDKVKVAKKIAKDMERWARTLNQKKENARSNIVAEQILDTSASKGSADIGFSVLGAGPSLTTIVRELSPPHTTDEFLVKKIAETTAPPLDNDDDGIIDWAKLTCLLCKRKFPSADVLNKHKTMSDLHKQNLFEYQKKNELVPQSNGYRDRAAERRMKFGEDEPLIRKRFEPPEVMRTPIQSHPPPSVVDTIGGKMLQKMGWSEGRGLGKEEQGRIAPIEAEQRPGLAGLGQKRGIYTPTPGETYRDTVKKLMIARYKEVVGQEDGL